MENAVGDWRLRCGGRNGGEGVERLRIEILESNMIWVLRTRCAGAGLWTSWSKGVEAGIWVDF